MTMHVRRSLLVLFGCAAALAAPAHAVTQTASVNASVVKPLTLTSLQGLNLGTIVLGPGTWSSSTVGISRAGVSSCGANVTCSGTMQVAQFTVTGSNSLVVKVTAPNVTLVNQADSSQTLVLAVDAPATVNLPNSGNKGINFAIGGSITVNSTTADGDYSGILNVTVDYQ